MNQFLLSLPKTTLAFLAIAGGIVFIVLSNPPHSVCDSQIVVVKDAQKSFMFPDEKSKHIKTTKYERLRDHCKTTNSPGGCYELFRGVREMLDSLSSLSMDCRKFVTQAPFGPAIWEMLGLLTDLAWGEKPPESYHAKFGWLDTSDVSLFCKLKARAMDAFGENKWNQFREKKMAELPAAKDLPRNQVWDLSLFSENCQRYP